MGFINSSNANLINVQYYNSTTFANVTGSGANADGNILMVSISGYTYNWINPINWFYGLTQFFGYRQSAYAERVVHGSFGNIAGGRQPSGAVEEAKCGCHAKIEERAAPPHWNLP